MVRILALAVVLSMVNTDILASHIRLSSIPMDLKKIHRHEIPHSATGMRFHGERIPGFIRFRPRKRDLKTKRLLRKLGKDFDENWMSIQAPVLKEERVVVSQTVQHIDLKLNHFFQNLNLTFLDNGSKVVNLSSEHLELFRGWLLRHGSCPVTHMWEDLSVLFWPRWIRRGYCDSSISCSWPPGMSCVPAESKIIKVLRWSCRRRKKKKRKTKEDNQPSNDKKNAVGKVKSRKRRLRAMRCKWLKVPFPVVDECFCSC